jgi:two-component system, OmpR family, sensor histidine kinase MprB
VSLRTRMAAVAGLAVALTVVALAVTQYEAARSTLRGQIDQALRERATPLASDQRGGPGDGDGDHGRPPPNPFGDAAGKVQYLTPEGTIPSATTAATRLPVDARAKALAASGTGSYFSETHVQGVHLRVLTVGLGPRGAVQIARPLTEMDRSLRQLLWILLAVGGGGIVLAAALGGVVARAALAPVSRFTRQTEALTANPDVTQRLQVDGQDEIARLARSFNATLDALEQSAEAQRHLVADASHELRTPIASLRANIQVLQDADRLPEEERESLRADIIAELDELTALVGDVVELARGAKPSDVVDDVRIDQIVRQLMERAERRAGDGAVFRADLEPTVVSGEPERISRAISNLLGNAHKWSPPGGLIEIDLRDGTLAIRDHGPGFDEADIPHVFDRFYRAASARGMPGSGLGLAIVRHAAEAHGGRVTAANAPGGGALLTVEFGPATVLGDEDGSELLAR